MVNVTLGHNKKLEEDWAVLRVVMGYAERWKEGRIISEDFLQLTTYSSQVIYNTYLFLILSFFQNVAYCS